VLAVGIILAEVPQAAGNAESARAAEPKFSWRQTETSIALVNGKHVVWRHVHDRKIGKPFMRIGLLDGTELTRPWPIPKGYPRSDHTWHRALWWSWKAIDGVNYWEKNQQGTDPVKVKVTTNKDGSARILMNIAYHLPDKAPVAEEERLIEVGAPDATGSYLVSWQATFTPGGKKAVVFNRNSYGGFAIRMAAEFCGDPKAGKPGWKFIRSKDQKTGKGRALDGVLRNRAERETRRDRSFRSSRQSAPSIVLADQVTLPVSQSVFHVQGRLHSEPGQVT